MKSKVYLSREITPEKTVELFDKLEKELTGNVLVKVHSGEKGNQNFLKPAFWKPIIDKVGGVVCECNTAYEGARNTTQKHLELIKEHGWNDFFEFDLLDAQGDVRLPIENGKVLKETYVGKNMMNYESLLVLSHFKGHPMGGYGGALKQLSIGLGSSGGKAWIHSGARTRNQDDLWGELPSQNTFLECMADASKGAMDFFKGKSAFINVMKNMSVDCDCCAVAEDPCMSDIGILASTDPVAVDKACIDLVYEAKQDKGQLHFLERLESRNGTHTIEVAYEIGVGNIEYELIEI